MNTRSQPSSSYKKKKKALEKMFHDVDRWATLPFDLLASISKRLPSPIDKIRVRGVCRAWRSLELSPPLLSSHVARARIPLPEVDDDRCCFPPKDGEAPFVLDETDRLTFFETPVCYLLSTTDPSHRGIVVKFGEVGGLKTQPEPPLNREEITSVKVLDLLNFRVHELGRACLFRFHGIDGRLMDVFAVSNIGDSSCQEVCLMGDYRGSLVHLRLGDLKWSVVEREDFLEEGPFYYSDAIYRNGRFYAVDDLGDVLIVDSHLNVEFVRSPVVVEDEALIDDENKHLVECEKQLYLVVDRQHCTSREFSGLAYSSTDQKNVRIKIFRFDDARMEWERVHTLGDWVFFVAGFSSFSVASGDFPQLGRNRVYFDWFDAGGDSPGERAGLAVFDVETGYWGCLSGIYKSGGCHVV